MAYGVLVVVGVACSTEPPPGPDTLDNEIVFTSWRDGTAKLYRMGADGNDVRPIPMEVTGSISTSSISPDGQWIAYNSSGEIWVMRPDGSEQRNLTQHTAEDQGPAWSADGRRIAFHSDRSGRQYEWDIHVMDADGPT